MIVMNDPTISEEDPELRISPTEASPDYLDDDLDRLSIQTQIIDGEQEKLPARVRMTTPLALVLVMMAIALTLAISTLEFYIRFYQHSSSSSSTRTSKESSLVGMLYLSFISLLLWAILGIYGSRVSRRRSSRTKDPQHRMLKIVATISSVFFLLYSIVLLLFFLLYFMT